MADAHMLLPAKRGRPNLLPQWLHAPSINDARLQRAPSISAHATSQEILSLQRTAGNQAVLQLLGRAQGQEPPSIQPKLTAGPTNDAYEREADAIASQIQTPQETHIPRQKMAEDGLQRRATVGPEGGNVDNDVAQQIRRSQHGGSSLPTNVRAPLESKLSADLSQVKVHTGPQSEQLNRQLGAKAFTHKNHIFYGAGQSPRDLSLTAHEAVHTIQQGAVKQTQRKTTDPVLPMMDTQGDTVNRIQRLSINDNPPRVDPNTIANPGYVKKSSAGNVGVYFVKDGNDEIVIKFMPKSDALRAQYADTIIRGGTDLSAPDSRVHFQGTPTFQSIAHDILAWKNSPRIANDNRLHTTIDADIGAAGAVMVMEKLSGSSVDTLVETDEGQLRLLAALRNPRVIHGMAQLIVIDALLGNSDRMDRGLTHSGTPKLTNIGNLFLSATGDQVVSLDNDAERIGRIPGNRSEQGQKNFFTGIEGSKATQIMNITKDGSIDTMVDVMLDACIHHAPPMQIPFLQETFNQAYRSDLKQRLRAAVLVARDQILKNLKSNKKTLKQQTSMIETTYGYDQPNNNLEMMPDWDSFRARAKLLQLRNKGVDETQALDSAFTHWQHKNQKRTGQLGRQKFFKNIRTLGGRLSQN